MVEAKERWRFDWNDLYHEIVESNICTGCSGCIVACPHDVLGYNSEWHPWLMEDRVNDELDRCLHGEKGCTMCTRACPRFRAWEPEIDDYLWGRPRDVSNPDEVIGVYQDIVLARTTNPEWLERGQDGGLCSAVLIYGLRNGFIDCALVNYVDQSWRLTPGVARNEDEVLAAAGSRYTYSANTLAYAQAIADDGSAEGEKIGEKIALVGMSCQSSVPPVMMKRGVRKAGKRFALNIGLLCSKTFTDDIFEGLLKAKYNLEREDIIKMNIKGKLQLWLRDGSHPDTYPDNYLEVPLKECHDFTRPGCQTCPDFAAEHADISMGGLGQTGGWTLTVIRTELGRKIFDEMVTAGWIEFSNAVDTDPAAVDLMRKLAIKSRKRWPVKVELGRPPEDARPGIY